MDIFSGNNLNINQPIYFDKIGNGPNLVCNDTMNEIKTLVKYKEISNDNLSSDIANNNIINNINGYISNFYTNYIQPNIFFIILAIFFSLFLYWKYKIKNNPDLIDDYIENYEDTRIDTDIEKCKKQKKIKKIEKKIKKIENLIDTIESSSYDSVKKDQGEFVANFNPSVPVSAQNSYVNYMGDNVPMIVKNNINEFINDNDNNTVNKNKITYNQYYKTPEPKYEYLPIIKNKINRSDTYTGLYNEYNNFIDQDYNNPYNWEQNYNESTHNAIEYATTKNRESLQLLNQSVDNTNNQIIKNIM